MPNDPNPVSAVTPADVRRAWRVTMMKCGFKTEGSVFVRRHGPFRYCVIIQSLRNRTEREMLVHLAVRIASTLESTDLQSSELFVTGYLEPHGVDYRIQMHWSPTALIGAHETTERLIRAFFGRFTDRSSMIEMVEGASRMGLTVQQFLAGPLPPLALTDEGGAEFVKHLEEVKAAMPLRTPPINETLLRLLRSHDARTANE
jgi:hypothetical protein